MPIPLDPAAMPDLIGIGHTDTVTTLFKHQELVPHVKIIACNYCIYPGVVGQERAWDRTTQARQSNVWAHIPNDFILSLRNTIQLMSILSTMPSSNEGIPFISIVVGDKTKRYKYYRFVKGVLMELIRFKEVRPIWEDNRDDKPMYYPDIMPIQPVYK